jgi:hypothetical protein
MVVDLEKSFSEDKIDALRSASATRLRGMPEMCNRRA